jgi:hypothetical protein
MPSGLTLFETTSADTFFEIAKKVVEKESGHQISGGDLNPSDIDYALKTLEIAALKYEAEKRWNNAMEAWALIERVTDNSTTKQNAYRQKEKCLRQFNQPLTFTPHPPGI